MFEQGATGGLTKSEKAIVKYLVHEGWTNQNIQALVNLGRTATVNPARIAEVKADQTQEMVTKADFDKYYLFKQSFDLRTGLNPFCDERLIKSRDAMKLAVSIFNNPTFSFRAENFSILANVAWTYFALEYSERKNLPTKRKNGQAISLADFLKQSDCPFDSGTKDNLAALIKIRDASEHTVLGPQEDSWIGIFQATCMNYERELTKHFGEKLSLASEITFALQFSSLSIGQAEAMAKAPTSPSLTAINSEIFKGLSEEQKNDTNFQFSVIYTTVASSKSKASIQFVSPESAEGIEIANVLVKHKPSHITHPLKPTDVVQQVKEKTGKKFNLSAHTDFWKAHSVRPDGNSETPEKTNLEYCYYHPTYKSYTYNQKWVELICKSLS